MARSKAGTLFIVSAPSGAGKTSLVEAVLEKAPEEIMVQRAVTYTTRSMRPYEINGKDYHFVTVDKFQLLKAQGHFVESSFAYGAFYGFPCSVIERMDVGESFIAIVDRSGAESLKSRVPHACTIWICPPDLATLQERLVLRNADSLEAIERRLMLAAHEIAREQENPLFEHHIVNNLFDFSVNQINQIILRHLKKPF